MRTIGENELKVTPKKNKNESKLCMKIQLVLHRENHALALERPIDDCCVGKLSLFIEMLTSNTRTHSVRRLQELLVLNLVVYIKYTKRYSLQGQNTAALTVIRKYSCFVQKELYRTSQSICCDPCFLTWRSRIQISATMMAILMISRFFSGSPAECWNSTSNYATTVLLHCLS